MYLFILKYEFKKGQTFSTWTHPLPNEISKLSIIILNSYITAGKEKHNASVGGGCGKDHTDSTKKKISVK